MEENENKDTKKKVLYYGEDYTKICVFPEKDALPQITFTYKPLNMIQSARLADEVLKDSTVITAAKANLKMLGNHIVDWSLSKPDGSAIDFKNMDELGRVDPTIINKIVATIRGDKGTLTEDASLMENSVKNL